ncbi:MAG TPA: DinB family protein [Methylomirabilota bacterium]|jgi:hypothetical protein|nr:DinB family protein [Methylomirabilota bacterium]
MAWPKPVDALWRELESVRAELLREVQELSQNQADWRPAPKDWSVGEVLDHVTAAEIATGKLTTKLTKEAAAGGAPAVFPHDLTEFPALPIPASTSADAPESVWPAHGKALPELVQTMSATRERTRQSFDRLGACDPRALRFKHFRLGDLDLSQWWRLQADHERVHLGQVRDIKRTPGFPAA